VSTAGVRYPRATTPVNRMSHVQRKRIIIADGSADSVERLSALLAADGYDTTVACRTADEIIARLESLPPDLVLMDVELPGGVSGIEVAQEKLQAHDIPVIYMMEHANDPLIERFRLTTPYGFLVKPVNEHELITNVSAALLRHKKNRELKDRESYLLKAMRRREIFGSIIGDSAAINEVFEKAGAILSRNMNVLITGESGTGKELLARAIHNGSPRNGGPFVAINCAAISRELSESLLFGHKKGAFTGSIDDYAGYFEQAHGGTIFLDEIGDMNTEVQAKILRVIEEKKVRRIGEKRERDVDMRIISATNRNLHEMKDSASFREDLYYRLEEYTISIPPLRERREDIPVLARHFLETFCEFYELDLMRIGNAALGELATYPWPGNVRELKNIIQKAAVQSTDSVIARIEIPAIARPRDKTNVDGERPRVVVRPDDNEILPLREVERRALARAIEHAGGNMARAAAMLGIGRATLYRKLEKLRGDN